MIGVKAQRKVDDASSPRPDKAWGEIGSTLARIGAPLEFAAAEAFDPFELELPLKGGEGTAPREIEVKRHIAAFIRELYDDIYDYNVEEARETSGDESAPQPAVAEVSALEAPGFQEVQAFDRRTGQPIKVKLNLQPKAPASTAR